MVVEYYKSMAEYQGFSGEYAQDFIDSEGNPIEVGSRLELIGKLTDIWTNGVEATVIYLTNTATAGLLFNVPDRSIGKRLIQLDGSETEAYRGLELALSYWRQYYAKCFHLIVKANPTEDEETAIVKRIMDVTLAEPRLLALDKRVYALTLVDKPEIENMMIPLRQAVTLRVKNYVAAARLNLQREREKFSKMLLMPNITLDQVTKYDLHYWSDGNCIWYSLPFHYNPQFVAKNDHPAHLIIDPEWQKKLEVNGYVHVPVSYESYIRGHNLYFDWQGRKPFTDLHCDGTLSQHFFVPTFADVVKFRDAYQVFCKIIAPGHYTSGAPIADGYPSLDEVSRHSKPVEPGDVWSVKNMLLTSYKIDSLVKILRVFEGNESVVGTVGRITEIKNGLSVPKLARIEFLFDHQFGGKIWNMPLDPGYLELAPADTARSRLAREGYRGSDEPGSQGWSTTATTTAPPSNPKDAEKAKIEAYEKAIKARKNPFNRGDRIQIAVDESVPLAHSRGGVTNQDVGTVTAVDSVHVQANFPSKGIEGWLGHFDQLKLVGRIENG
jgi:hypothetical protein